MSNNYSLTLLLEQQENLANFGRGKDKQKRKVKPNYGGIATATGIAAGTGAGVYGGLKYRDSLDDRSVQQTVRNTARATEPGFKYAAAPEVVRKRDVLRQDLKAARGKVDDVVGRGKKLLSTRGGKIGASLAAVGLLGGTVYGASKLMKKKDKKQNKLQRLLNR